MIRQYVTINGTVLHNEQVKVNINERPNTNLIDILAITNGLEPYEIHTEIIFK